jgi:uroporphyrinogen decarboxylase
MALIPRARIRAMTKGERVMTALKRERVDRPPVAFWRHAPEIDHDPQKLADTMLHFHRRFDLDLIKLMSSGVYCVEDWGCRVAYTGEPNGAKRCTQHAVQGVADWARLAPLDPGAGALGRELEALRLTARGRADDAPVLHTIFSPLTIARKLAGERVAQDLADAPEALLAALAVIAQTVVRYAAAALEAGADGLFLATQTASADVFPESAWAQAGEPFMRSVLKSLEGACPFIMLHAHGKAVHFGRLAALPVHAMNWHDRAATPALGEGKRRFRGAVVGGLAEWTTLRTGTVADVVAQTRDAIAQTGGLGVIVGPGCVLPLDVPDEHLDAVVRTVKAATPS